MRKQKFSVLWGQNCIPLFGLAVKRTAPHSIQISGLLLSKFSSQALEINFTTMVYPPQFHPLCERFFCLFIFFVLFLSLSPFFHFFLSFLLFPLSRINKKGLNSSTEVKCEAHPHEKVPGSRFYPETSLNVPDLDMPVSLGWQEVAANPGNKTLIGGAVCLFCL